MRSFGNLLRDFRLSCKDPKNSQRLLSQERFGELLGDEVGGGFSGAAISDWERGVSKIHADHRPVLIGVIKVLQQYGGVDDLAKANELLNVGNYRALDQQEINLLFPGKSPSNGFASQEETSTKIWPPGIPDEEYYPLPHREKHLLTLLKLLKDNDGPSLISIDGLGGIGKTSLVAELSRRAVAANLFQDVLGETAKQEILADDEIIQLKGSILGYENLLDALASQLQLWDLFTMDAKDKETIISQILRQNRHLVFVDNLETVENANALVARLRNILGTSRAIITTRQKVHFNFAHSFTLEGLDLDDSLLFMRSAAEKLDVKQILDAGRKTLMEIFELTGGSPLAMKLAVAQAKFLELDRIFGQMRKANNNLYFFIFKESWEQLSRLAKNTLVYVGKTAVVSVSIQELSDAEFTDKEDDLIKSIDQLVNYSLFNVSYLDRQIRYSIHPLTRQFIVRDLPMLWKEQGLM